jgi:hypothetical protein
MALTIRMERRLVARLTSKKTTLDRYRPLTAPLLNACTMTCACS